MSYTNYDCTYRRNKITLPPGARMDSLFTPTSDKKFALGTILEMDDGTGRMFRYCYNGAVALTRCFMGASEAPHANGYEIAQTGYDFANGDQVISILLTTGHGYADDELIDGFLYFGKSPTDGFTVGDFYIIKSNKITTSDTVMKIEIADEGGLRLSTAATSDDNEISVMKNPYHSVVVNPTSQAAIVVGVPLVDVAINYYYFAQYRGPCPLIVDDGETIVIGEPVGKPGTAGDTGACGVVANDGTDCVWGTVMQIAATDEPAIVNLMLP